MKDQEFQQWFESQDFYTSMRLTHGDRLFDKDWDIYRVLPVQMTWMAWGGKQAELNEKDRRIAGLESRIVLIGGLMDAAAENGTERVEIGEPYGALHGELGGDQITKNNAECIAVKRVGGGDQ